MEKVRPKKSLGQHFLHDQVTARKIVAALSSGESPVLEVGPGMGVLTQYLIERPATSLTVVEIDRESVAYLREKFPALTIVEGDFLELDLTPFPSPLKLIGNFPYNISSQIFFKVLENREQVKEVVCMIQKEVAERIAAPHGNKTYGILSVLLQTWYTVKLEFKVNPGAFHPPPKVVSAVIRLERNSRQEIGCDPVLWQRVVKQGFNNRRKTLRNALRPLEIPADLLTHPWFDKRAEQLSVEEFISLTRLIESR